MDKKQWHPAFCGATEWELKDNKDDLDFESEYNLSKKPLQMDMLVVKKRHDADIVNEIGKVFKAHNIIEFKGEGDSLSIDDFYKVLGYACIYKSLGKHVDEIPGADITVTFIRHAYPRELFKSLDDMGTTVEEKYPGIYYVTGDVLFPVQVIVTKELDSKKHSGLKILTSKAEESDIRQFLKDTMGVTEPGDLHNIDAMLQVSVTANNEVYEIIRGDDIMCQALQDLMKDEIDKKVADGRADERIIVEQNKDINAIKNLMKNLKLSAEQAMDALGISQEARGMYLSKL